MLLNSPPPRPVRSRYEETLKIKEDEFVKEIALRKEKADEKLRKASKQVCADSHPLFAVPLVLRASLHRATP